MKEFKRTLYNEGLEIDFPEIKKGMKLTLKEHDGEIIVEDVIASSDGFLNEDGVWTFEFGGDE